MGMNDLKELPLSTRSNLYVETEPGTYIGTYCHYDGYPDYMLETISEATHDEFRGMILVAGLRGGFRIFSTAPPPNGSEYLCDDEVCYFDNPATTILGADYVYIKNLDGQVQYRSAYGSSWMNREGETVSEAD